MKIRDDKKKMIKLTALLVCFTLIGVSAAAIYSNTLITQLSVDDPNYVLSWGTLGAPVAQTILEECPFDIDCATSEIEVYMTLHVIVSESSGLIDLTTVEVYMSAVQGVYAIGWYPLDAAGELDLPWNLNDALTFSSSIRFMHSADYTVSFVLTDTLVY